GDAGAPGPSPVGRRALPSGWQTGTGAGRLPRADVARTAAPPRLGVPRVVLRAAGEYGPESCRGGGFPPRRAVCRRPGARCWRSWWCASAVPYVMRALPSPHGGTRSAVRVSGLRPPDADLARVVLRWALDTGYNKPTR